MTPTSRTLKLLRDEGKIAEVTEVWNCFTHKRKDFLNFVDIIALDVVNKITWGIQCTSTGNVNARIKKICNECKENALAWLMTGNKIEVIGWSKKGKAGKRKLWQVVRKVITIEELSNDSTA
jgi:hypothetical protein